MGDWIDIHTQNSLQYVFIPESSGAIQLRVKAANDAHIALTNGPLESDPMTEIHIGGWDNTKSIVRRNRREPDKVKVETPGILDANTFVDLWIRWQYDEIAAGVKGRPAFIQYKDPQPHPIDHISVRTGWGSIGHWQIQVSPIIYRSLSVKPIEGGKLHWVEKRENEPLPRDAFIGGYENGEVLYIARALHVRSLTPGKYMPSKDCAFVGYGLQSARKSTCEILCGYNASWEKTEGNFIPPHSFVAGYAAESNREPFFIGRAYVEGSHLIPGKVHTHYKTCYLPYKDIEVQVHKYEILVVPDQLPDAVIWRTQPMCRVDRRNADLYNHDDDNDSDE